MLCTFVLQSTRDSTTGDEVLWIRTMVTIGRIEEFKEGKDDWSQYAERLEFFSEANGIKEDAKKRPVFLTVIGAKAYKQLRCLISPVKPNETEYADLLKAMKDHYKPAPSEIVQRFKFNSRSRRPGESVSSYVAELRSLAEYCNFGDTLELMLRDRLVCGINNETTQRLLLAESALTYKKALEIATSQETAAQNVQMIRGTHNHTTVVGAGTPSEPINVLKSTSKQPSQHGSHKLTTGKQPAAVVTCYRCGKSGHKATQCRFIKAKCHNCGKIGHLMQVCRSSKVEKPSDDVKVLSSVSEPEYGLFHLKDINSAENPYKVSVNVNGETLTMEIDTGASLSLISEQTYKFLWPEVPLQNSSVKLKTYTGTPLKVLGVMSATVLYESQTATLHL